MVNVGYKLSSEEFAANDLIRFASRAEEVGFEFALISDHFHPWSDRQGQSPFVWSVLGALSQATEELRIGTAVTCPTIRIHPAIVAQAAATVTTMMGDRFFLGVGTGENLNEHVVGAGWPSAEVRVEMLAEAIDVMRALWKGDEVSHRGRYYTVEGARLYSVPDEPPAVMVAANKPAAIELAGRVGDALITTELERKVIEAFRAAGGDDKPSYTELSVCWARSEAQAVKTAHEVWSLAALEGSLFTELPLPSHFESAFKMVSEESVAEAVVCGPDVEKHLEAIEKAARAGFSHVCVHQIGPDQAGFFDFYEREVLPRIGRSHLKLADKPKRPSGRSQGSGARRTGERVTRVKRARVR